MSARRSKEARRSRAVERDARGGGAPRALRNARLCLTALIFVVMAGGTSVLACPVCFGAAETPLIDGAKLGILVLLAVTFTVQGAFVAFFFYLRKRAKRIADLELDDEWSELQGASRT